jgi:hypothetical protein
LGQKRTLTTTRAMSALPPIADIVQHGGIVRFVPKADLCTTAILVVIRSQTLRNVAARQEENQ